MGAARGNVQLVKMLTRLVGHILNTCWGVPSPFCLIRAAKKDKIGMRQNRAN